MSEGDDGFSEPVDKVQKRRSRSCPRENTENDSVKIQFFSPSGTAAKHGDAHKKGIHVSSYHMVLNILGGIMKEICSSENCGQ